MQVISAGLLELILVLSFQGCVRGGNDSGGNPPTRICALEGAAVDMSYNHTAANIKSAFWFSPKQNDKWRWRETPEDLALDLDYAGRVHYEGTDHRASSMRITDLRVTDSGPYYIRVTTETTEGNPSAYTVEPGFILQVTDLQVKNQMSLKKMVCQTTCNLPNNPEYIWYKNKDVKQRSSSSNSRNLYIQPYSSDSNSYSCAVQGKEELRSAAVCVNQVSCWNVEYSRRRLCALRGASVDITCTYTHPRGHRLTKTFWYYNWGMKRDPDDLSADEMYVGRITHILNDEKKSRLRIQNLTERDSKRLFLRIVTDKEKYYGEPGVNISITDLQVKLSPATVREGQSVTLTCSTTCTLTNSPTYIWYRNRQPVTNKHTKYSSLYLDSVSIEDAGNYTCAARGHEDLLSPAQTLTVRRELKLSGTFIFTLVGIPTVLVLIVVAYILWRRCRKTKSSPDCISTEGKTGVDSAHVYDDILGEARVSVPSQGLSSDNQDCIQYMSVHFKQAGQQDVVSSQRLKKEEEVHYAAVSFSKNKADSQ